MRPLALFVILALLPSCRGNDFGKPGGGPGGGGGPGTLKSPDLVIQELEVLGSAPGPLGTTALQLRIRVANLKPMKPWGLPVQKPFQVSVVVTNAALPDENDPVTGEPLVRGLAVPVGFGLVGAPGDLARVSDMNPPTEGPYLASAPSDLTITGPIDAGEYVEVVRTAFLRIPWAPGTASLRVRATADWTDVILERNESNNTTEIPLGS